MDENKITIELDSDSQFKLRFLKQLLAKSPDEIVQLALQSYSPKMDRALLEKSFDMVTKNIRQTSQELASTNREVCEKLSRLRIRRQKEF